MITGIDVNKIDNLKKELLNYIEEINSIFNRMDSEVTIIQSNMSGVGKIEILQKCNKIKEQVPVLKSNIMVYLEDLSKVVKFYENQDQELSQNVIRNISKLDEGGE